MTEGAANALSKCAEIPYYEVSALSGYNVDRAFEQIATKCLIQKLGRREEQADERDKTKGSTAILTDKEQEKRNCECG